MSTDVRQSSSKIFADLKSLLADLENVYKDIHSHPELSMQENRTSSLAADHLRKAGYEVTTGVGKTGVVGLLRKVMAQPSCFGPTWMPCRSKKQQVCPMPAR
jgi:metal-dependent amidase/aminoacylase/carboxypeptidase family protein